VPTQKLTYTGKIQFLRDSDEWNVAGLGASISGILQTSIVGSELGAYRTTV